MSDTQARTIGRRQFFWSGAGATAIALFLPSSDSERQSGFELERRPDAVACQRAVGALAMVDVGLKLSKSDAMAEIVDSWSAARPDRRAAAFRGVAAIGQALTASHGGSHAEDLASLTSALQVRGSEHEGSPDPEDVRVGLTFVAGPKRFLGGSPRSLRLWEAVASQLVQGEPLAA